MREEVRECERVSMSMGERGGVCGCVSACVCISCLSVSVKGCIHSHTWPRKCSTSCACVLVYVGVSVYVNVCVCACLRIVDSCGLYID